MKQRAHALRKGFFSAVILLLIFSFPFAASANIVLKNDRGDEFDMTTLFKAESFTSSTGTTLQYRIFLPEDYNAAKKYPLILFLHGAGERGNDNESQLKTGICEPFKKVSSEIYDCIVLAPQCPADSKWVNVEQWTDCEYDSEKIPESAVLAAAVELFEQTKATYSVDPDRVYVTGLSMGGYGTWDLLVRHPDLFAAAMPLCGGADYRKADLIRDIPIWTFHGSADPTVPPHGTERMVNEIIDTGGDECIYTVYENSAHNIWGPVYSRTDILPWLLSKKLSDRLGSPSETAKQTEATETTAPTPTETTQPVTADEPPATESETTEAPKNASCKSSVGAAIPAMGAAAVFAAVATKKKKKED